ncbi:aminotransferase class I/II-fold pyridoxal phosphate-dependent enzyme [Flavihumibacter rivuli]|uniref:aminotransferase class I/II-fold pyridoxal phosphate-dependent enzyme n=1 Tax=Flavihumibacter rivuli TaxID=2838156 RepID=UPI001BDE170F|nr:aminotransferase class I/II-fold pyridoxal phosphate-dependent enzyme [Flavihumibacter rivuli]ULQ55778.1 aminotransferase class I/II-fold pyridoxal phosphate-dependent enzyme [Flavihumibacter rivuli]
MFQVNALPGRTLLSGGKEWLYFGGTAYLGLPGLPEFQELVINNIRKWGTAYGSSRNANIRLSAYAEGEAFLAKLTGTEMALTVSSGMLAGKLAIEALTVESNRFFYLPGHHPAIWAANSEPFYTDGQINPSLLNEQKEKIVILTDAVPSFSVKAVELNDLEKISPAKQVTLVVDESHTLGILGKNGGGILSGISYPNISRKIMVSSLGKAMGLTGGVIAADGDFITSMRKLDGFVSGAGMQPAFVQTIAEAGAIYQQQHERLQSNTRYLYELLKGYNNLTAASDYPAFYPHDADSYQKLLQHHIIITHFTYPTSPLPLNRIVVSAHHTLDDLNQLAKAFG